MDYFVLERHANMEKRIMEKITFNYMYDTVPSYTDSILQQRIVYAVYY